MGRQFYQKNTIRINPIPFTIDFLCAKNDYTDVQIKIQKRAENPRRLKFTEAEKLVIDGGRKINLSLLQDIIKAAGIGDIGPVLFTKSGEKLNYKRKTTRHYKTLLGDIKVKRTGYYAKGMKVIFPLDAYFNLSCSSFSHCLRKRVAFESARGSFRDASNSIWDSNRIKLHTRQIEEIAISAAADFLDFYRKRSNPEIHPDEKTSPLLILSLDSKGIIMRHQDLTSKTRKAGDKKPRILKHRLTTGEKANRKRMATAGAVYSINRFVRTPEQVLLDYFKHPEKMRQKRPKPFRKRVWARIDASPDEVTDEVFAEALKRDPNQKKTWAILVDGDPHQIRRIDQRIQSINRHAVIILDIVHVMGYIWNASKALFQENHLKCQTWVHERLLAILSGKAANTAAGIRKAGTIHMIKGTRREQIDLSANYILKNLKYMKYHRYLKFGLPIGSGIIEGVCRHLIKDRMDVTGARWSLKGAEAILRLRSIKSSGDFNKYWIFHENQEYLRNYGTIDIEF